MALNRIRPFLYQLRTGTETDPYIDKSETITPVDGRAVLEEIPVKGFGVLISGYVEKASNTPAPNEFYVDYSNGVIYFNKNITTALTIRYRGRGVVKVPAERIFFSDSENMKTMDVSLKEINQVVAKSEAALSDFDETLKSAALATGKANEAYIAAQAMADHAEIEGNIARSRGEFADSMGQEAQTQAAYAKSMGDYAHEETLGLNAIKDTVSQAIQNADTATENATYATGLANQAATNADSKSSLAQVKIDAMNVLTGEVNVLKGALETKIAESNIAISDAIDSASKAQVAADYATQQGQIAQSEASNLETLKENIQSATVDANNSAANAQEKSIYADQQGLYAKTQGDYAKSQGDAIQDILENGNVASVNGKTGAVVLNASDVGTIPTEEIDSKIQASIDELVGSAPGTLDTLNELAEALGNDPNFATTISNEIATKAEKEDFDAHKSNTEVHVSLLEKESWNKKIDEAKVGVPGGVAQLGVDGKVDPLQLPEIASSWNDLQNKPTEFKPSSHTHDVSDINGLQQALDSAAKMEKYETIITATQGQTLVQIPWVTFDSVNDFLSLHINRTVLTKEDYSLTGRNITLSESLNDGDTVHIVVLKAVVRGTDEPISAANLSDGSITNEKMSNDIKIGALQNLNTQSKDSVVGAINELSDGQGSLSGRIESLSADQSSLSQQKAIENVLLYYGYPIGFNGLYDREKVSSIYSKYDMVVLGDTYQDPEQEVYEDTVAVIKMTIEKNSTTQIIGYIPLGVSDSGLSMIELKNRVDQWSLIGATGIFLDEYGYDYRVTRERQNEIVSYIHNKNMNVVANSWKVDYVFNSSSMYLSWIDFEGNANSVPPVLNENDYVVFENAWYYDKDGVQAASSKTQWDSETRMYEAYYYHEIMQANGKSYFDTYKTKSFALDGIKNNISVATAEKMAQTGKLASIVMKMDAYGSGSDYWGAPGIHREYYLSDFPELKEKGKSKIVPGKIGTTYYNTFERQINKTKIKVEWIQDQTNPDSYTLGSHRILVGDDQSELTNVFKDDLERHVKIEREVAKIGILSDKTEDLKTLKTNKDANGVYTTVTYRRKSDNTIYAISVLSGGTSPLYTTRTITYYETDGGTVRRTTIYALSYDVDGVLVGEV